MAMNRKNIYIIGTVVIAVILGFTILTGFLTSQQKTPTQEDLILNTITESVSPFSHEGRSIVEIESISRHEDGWYIVELKPVRSYKGYIPVKLIMSDTGGTLNIISGPDTYFGEPELLKLNVPDSVILELRKS
jgi:hypothetical protein